MSKDDALAQLRRRIAARIDAAMDWRSFPSRTAQRRQMLADALNWDISTVNGIVSGAVTPTLAQLLALGEALHQPPCYFVDASETSYPPGTCLVPSLSHGGPMVLHLPAELVESEAVARYGMSYVYVYEAMGFGIAAGEYVVCLTPAPHHTPEPGHLYLFEEEEGIKLRRCVDLDGARVVFEDAEGAVAIMHPGNCETPFGRVVALIRPPQPHSQEPCS